MVLQPEAKTATRNSEEQHDFAVYLRFKVLARPVAVFPPKMTPSPPARRLN